MPGIARKPQSEQKAAVAYESCLTWTFVLFFCNAPLEKVFSGVCSLFGLDDSIGIVICSLIIYSPYVYVLVSSPIKRFAPFPELSFFYIYLGLVIFFVISQGIHPQYASKMFQEGWNYNILDSVFNPLCPVFAYFVITAVNRPSLIMRGLRIAAYVNFAYCVVRFVNAMMRGYWDAYSHTGVMIHSSYSLGFGYDMLFSALVFALLAFKGEQSRIHAVLCILTAASITVAGSRGSLAVLVIAVILFFAYTNWEIVRADARKLLFVGLLLVVMVLLVVYSDYVLEWLSGVLASAEIHSRTIETMLNGGLVDGNGREDIYPLAISLIENGGLLGYGAYGDRYYLGSLYYWGYPHNILLELQIQFGVFLGTLLLSVILGVFLLTMASSRVDERYKEILLLFGAASLQLFVSNSYLYSVDFWSVLGLLYLARTQATIHGQVVLPDNEERSLDSKFC